MLKKIILNGKRIPVPIPIKVMSEALAWVEKHLLRPDYIITRIELNGSDVGFCADGTLNNPQQSLNDETDLRFQMDSPAEICIQTMDAMRNLAAGISRNLKPVAVQLWEHKGFKLPVEAKTVFDDIDLLIELCEHVMIFVDKRSNLSAASAMQNQILKANASLKIAAQSHDWRGVAKVLLNQIEKPVIELSHTQKSIFELENGKKVLSGE